MSSAPDGPVSAATLPITDPWSSHAGQWRLLGPPLRPVADDVRAVMGQVEEWERERRGGILPPAPRAMLLGVTPELATAAWPAGTSLLAVDRSQSMIEAVFPSRGLPETARAVCADWRAIPVEDGSIDVVVGDGCFSVFGFPGEVRAFAAEIRRVLADDGRFVIRAFAAPTQREDLSEIARDLEAGRIGNFHCLKWRLAMTLHPSSEIGVVLSDVHSVCLGLRTTLDRLAGTPGFEPDVVSTIHAYAGSAVKYTFPAVEELGAALEGIFEIASVVTKDYELGDRCPTLVLRPAGRS